MVSFNGSTVQTQGCSVGLRKSGPDVCASARAGFRVAGTETMSTKELTGLKPLHDAANSANGSATEVAT